MNFAIANKQDRSITMSRVGASRVADHSLGKASDAHSKMDELGCLLLVLVLEMMPHLAAAG